MLGAMEGSTSEAPDPSAAFQFSPHRKSHLRSHTYSTLLRILSHCHQHSLCSHDNPVPEHENNGLERLTENEVGSELVGAHNVESEEIPNRKDPRVHDSPEGLSIRTEPVVDESAEGIGFQEVGLSNVQVIMDDLEQILRGQGNSDAVSGKDQSNTSHELEHLMEEKEDNRHVSVESVNLLTSALDRNQNSSHVDKWIKNHANPLDIQHVILEEEEDGEQVKASNGQNSLENLEALVLSVDDYIDGEDSKADENNNEKDSPLKGIATEDLGFKMQQEEMEFKKSVSPTTASSPLHMKLDGDMEEGEISGDFMGDDLSSKDDFLIGDPSIRDDGAAEVEKGEKESVYEYIINKEVFPFNEPKGVNYKDSESISKIMSSVDKTDNGVKVTKSKRKQRRRKSQTGRGGRTIDGAGRKNDSDPMAVAQKMKMKGRAAKLDFDCPANFLDDLAYHGESFDKNVADDLPVPSVKEGTGATRKRKQELGEGKKGKKAKNKQNERKKRAEKNRELGVKRLILPPVLKPKTINYCSHYLRGKCEKGADCRFSHDTTPFTKSKPCKYFCQGICMKGDDCPFDHQLSKYPCDQYLSRGFCSRNDGCLFSHKIPPKESSPTASTACNPVSEPPSLPRKLNSDAASRQDANSYRFSKLKQVDHVPKMDEGSKVDDQKTRGGVQSTDDKTQRAPVTVPPRGINFLSFSKASSSNSSVKEMVGSPSNREDGIRTSTLGDSKYKQIVSSSSRDGSINTSNHLNQTAAETLTKSNDALNSRQPAVKSPGINFLSSCKTSSDDSSCTMQSKSLPQSGSCFPETPIQERQRASVGFQIPTSVQRGLPASPSTSVSDRLVHGHNKESSSSAQKALYSMLAFAAKYESALKTDRSTAAAPSVSMEADNKQTRNDSNGGDSQNTAMKASALLDSLFGSGSKIR